MPSRLLREGILDSEAVSALTPQAEVFYRRLMSVVDDYGRFDGRPAVLRSRLYPLQLDKVREIDISKWLVECTSVGLVSTYAVAGKPYLVFHKLGSPRAKESRYPDPPDESGRTDLQPGENICLHPRADVNRCAQTFTPVPYSGSGSGSDKNPPTPRRGESADYPSIPADESQIDPGKPRADGPTRRRPTDEIRGNATFCAPEPVDSASPEIETFEPFDALLDAWKTAKLPGFDREIRRTSHRVGWWQLRLGDEFWRRNWRRGIDILARSLKARGGDPKFPRGVRLDDFLSKPDYLARILEGEFDDPRPQQNQPAVDPAELAKREQEMIQKTLMR